MPALADPVTITGGSVTSGIPGGPFQFNGAGLSVSGGVEGITTSALNSCRPCTGTPPETLSLSGTTGWSLESGDPGTIDGTYYAHTYLAGIFNFYSSEFSTAELSPTNLTVSAPFTMDGFLENYATSAAVQTGSPLVRLDLVGSGTATVRFVADPLVPGEPQLYDAQQVTYDFSPAAQTPEPASLLLLGTGAAGLVARRRRMPRA